ncbi:hypothetical protein [Ideonella sp. A 288]|uniref:hypothetical protein n=1 Tax=Ideonella sp. A 288 TaxID=1962181 RepID=UPI000B4A593C|nr:hypothetical protein [Ideonella sp. A 288]
MSGQHLADAGRRLMRRQVWRWRDRLGTPGLLALGLAVLALAVAAGAVHDTGSLQAEEARLRDALAAAATARTTRPVATQTPAQAVLQRLPSAAQRPDDVALVLSLARAHGLIAAPMQYRLLERRSEGIERLEITIGADHAYEPWRALMIDLLNRLPHATVAQASWSRSEVEGDDKTQARLRIVLYHRRQP